ncbi:MAG: acyl-ACP thioesterase domain-containing protein [Geobacteraceae bacterium]
MNTVFTARYRVRSYETDFKRRLKPVSLLHYFQDAASSHATFLGFSVADLLRKRMTWMLSRYQIRIFRYPTEGENLLVRTWRSAVDGYHALRDFEIFDDHDRLLAIASSSWLIVSVDTRRPVRIKVAVEDFPIHPCRSFPDDFVTFSKRAFFDRELPFRVRMGDLDQNRHVNNAVYLDWAIEAIPPDIVENYLPAEIHIAYRSEAFYGGSIVSRSVSLESPDPWIYQHQLVSEGEGRELTRLMTIWQSRESL